MEVPDSKVPTHQLMLVLSAFIYLFNGGWVLLFRELLLICHILCPSLYYNTKGHVNCNVLPKIMLQNIEDNIIVLISNLRYNKIL